MLELGTGAEGESLDAVVADEIRPRQAPVEARSLEGRPRDRDAVEESDDLVDVLLASEHGTFGEHGVREEFAGQE